MTYNTLVSYYQSSQNDAERLVKIRAIISTLMDQMAEGVENANIQSYQFDSGQTRVETVYRSPVALDSALTRFMKLENTLVYRLRKTRCIVLRPSHHPKIGNF